MFVDAHPDFWKSEFGYIPNGKAGQKSAHYVTFTELMLRPAIEQITGETVTFDYKRAGGRADSSAADRGKGYPWLAAAVPNQGSKPKSER